MSQQLRIIINGQTRVRARIPDKSAPQHLPAIWRTFGAPQVILFLAGFAIGFAFITL